MKGLTSRLAIAAASIVAASAAETHGQDAGAASAPVPPEQARASPPVPAPPIDDPDRAMRQEGPDDDAAGPFADQPAFKLFPAEQPKLMPYLASTTLYGDQCLQQGALIAGDPLSLAAQAVKTELAKYGVNYAIWQSMSYSAMSGVLPGKDGNLGYYSFNSYLTWNIFQSDDLSGTAGWLTLGASAGTGLGTDAGEQNVATNIGVVGFPVGTEYGQQAFLYQCAWQQSFLDGQLVATVGFMDPEVYMDLNTYSNNQYNQLMNYEFINPSTIPWSFNALGAVIQWQPVDWFYAMFGSLANNTASGRSPFQGISSDDWSNTFELGLIAEEMLGMGRAVYRVLPYWGSYGGETGSGVLLNVEQQLWKGGPAGVFVRTGYTGGGLARVQNGRANFSAGLVFDGPSESALLRTEQAYFAAGFYWLQAADPGTSGKEDEYGAELTYVFQLTETMTLQPDLQFVWDAVDNPDNDFNTVFTMQVNYVW